MNFNKFTLCCYLLMPVVYLQAYSATANCDTPISASDVPEFIAPERVAEYLADVTERQQNLCSREKGFGQDKAIYIKDNRYDAYLAKGAIRQAARSTAALILKSELKKEGGNYVSTKHRTLREVGWCANESFSNQPTLASCSSFLVTNDTLVTAGHCFRGNNTVSIDKYYVVFGYEMHNKRQAQLRFPASDVYEIVKEIEVKKSSVPREDWAVVQLNRPVLDRQIFEFKGAEISKNTELTLFGYPNGLPLKIANGGKVLENQQGKTVFATDVDAFHGNSGSPVLNSDGLKQNPPRFIVEGILVSGADDYSKQDRQRQGCARSVVCDSISINYRGGNCSSEIVTKINRVVAVDNSGSSHELGSTSSFENNIGNLFK